MGITGSAGFSESRDDVDEYTRECLALRGDQGITSEDAIDTRSKLFAMRGVPRSSRSDNDPEFFAQALRRSMRAVGGGMLCTEPRPLQETGCAEGLLGSV